MLFCILWIGIDSFRQSQWQECLDVVPRMDLKRLCEKCLFSSSSSRSKAERGEVGTTITPVCPSLFAPGFYRPNIRAELVKENRWLKSLKKLQMLRWLLNLSSGSILVSLWGETMTDRQKTVCRRCQTRTLNLYSVSKKVLYVFNIFSRLKRQYCPSFVSWLCLRQFGSKAIQRKKLAELQDLWETGWKHPTQRWWHDPLNQAMLMSSRWHICCTF